MKIILSIILFLVMLFFGQVMTYAETGADPWKWIDKNGNVRTEDDFKKILDNHEKWSNIPWDKRNLKDPLRANFEGANLFKANLKGVNLFRADLNDANLDSANLEGANLFIANLKGANLFDANLKGANLYKAILKGANLFKANLKEANLDGANLEDAALWQSNLEGEDLSGANLKGADLDHANLKGASLSQANLEGASLNRANLEGADLFKANLKGANLFKANLKGADLNQANLEGADLGGANVKGAKLSDANLSFCNYEPVAVPDENYISGIKGLTTINFEDGRQGGLTLLRKQFKAVGLRQLEREATFALERGTISYAPWYERYLNRIFFEWPCGYGLNYWRPLQIIICLIPLFALAYLYLLDFFDNNDKKNGIFVHWPEDRSRKDLPEGCSGGAEVYRLNTTSFTKICLYSLYFSLLSAFNLGWQDFSVSNWITRLQPCEYSLRATGWIRTVSGVQSLISVYLIALLVLTCFGRPFG